MQRDQIPELSIIVPALDEAAELPHLFETLSAQEGVGFELILCDGGSSDGTQRRAAELGMGRPFPSRLIQTPNGRGRQMNAGAAIAAGRLLLFLHADSRFPDRDSLCRAVSSFGKRLAESASQGIAARFALRFRRSDAAPSPAYLFYEAKARLDRADCIRGDQGFMFSRGFFEHLGGFETTLPFYEDVRLAALVAKQGAWCLLPAEISTSARRFESEGLYERQVVNAIIVNNSLVDWPEFFAFLPGLYQCNADTGRLLLFPLLEGIRTLLDRQSPSWRRTFWRVTGGHVAANAWQIFFCLDVRRCFRAGGGANEVSPRLLGFFERRVAWLFATPLAACLTAVVVRIWFRLLRLIRARSEGKPTGTS